MSQLTQQLCTNTIKYFFLCILWFVISVPTATADQFQMVMSLLSLENILKRRSRSASCVYKLPKYYFVQATCANRVVFTPAIQCRLSEQTHWLTATS
jgi:hypothetical protein